MWPTLNTPLSTYWNGALLGKGISCRAELEMCVCVCTQGDFFFPAVSRFLSQCAVAETRLIPLTLKLSPLVSREDDPSVTLLITMHRACSSACSALSSWTQMVIRVVEIGFFFSSSPLLPLLCYVHLVSPSKPPACLLRHPAPLWALRLRASPHDCVFTGRPSAVWWRERVFEFQIRLLRMHTSRAPACGTYAHRARGTAEERSAQPEARTARQSP